MAIEIVRAEDPLKIEHLVAVIYSSPGLGKSSLGFTADRPILLDFDKGAHRAANRKDSVQVRSWKLDIVGIEEEDLKPFKTVIVDTAGRAIEFLSDYIMDRDRGLRRKDGSLTIQGYGVLKTEFGRWIGWLRRQDLDVVLLAHVQESGDGENAKERIDVTGGSKNEIYKMADLMGTIRVDGRRRVIEFDPTEATFGKNPAGFPTTVFANPAREPNLLAQLIANTKEAINAMNDEQKAEYERQTDIRNAFAKYTSAEEFNATAKAMSEAGAARVDKSILMDVARSKEIGWDRDQGCFVDPKPPEDEDKGAEAAQEPGNGADAGTEGETKDSGNAPQDGAEAAQAADASSKPEPDLVDQATA